MGQKLPAGQGFDTPGLKDKKKKQKKKTLVDRLVVRLTSY